ncbi:MAG TPA: ABC transporter ATP-binding protein [Pyrinomonadaceae bacterium]|nr:ABC transporter ATP-binding protein [Pyrinomonadaceae bacterium]HLE62979.1 ABC transporter ATP-binding protein [Pyrinomonadaceae bacterium]
MTDIAIRCENLSKQYRIGEQERYKALRDVIADAAKKPFRRLRAVARNGNSSDNSHSEIRNTIWALDNVSFEVTQGEVIGIIGRNGAGKSTLLKILSRITKPTRGDAFIHGRVGSLLEVGTGFHPELTGRENIYLNGAILGMHKAEIDKKFDEIVAFAEVEKFIDTPVKRYSSGMHVRLAFAVAAHLDTEILLVDEVLAVGDADFQKKCLRKMGDVTKKGRTTLFVSHNMESVARLCPRALLLEKGAVEASGSSTDVIAKYLHSGFGLLAIKNWPNPKAAPGDEVVRLNLVRVRNEAGETQQILDSCQPIGIEIGYSVRESVSDLAAEFVVYDRAGNLLFTSANQYDERLMAPYKPGDYLSTCWIPGNLMTEGTFFIRVSIVELQVPIKVHVFEENILVFQVVDNMQGNSARGRIAHNYPGLIRPRLTWSTAFLEHRA